MYLVSGKFLESRDTFSLVYHFQCPPQCLKVEVTEKTFVEQMGESTFWSYPALQHEPYVPPGMAMPGALNCWFSSALGASILLSLQLNFLPPSLPSKCFSWEFKYSPSTKSSILSLAPHNRSLNVSCWDFLKHYVVRCIWRMCFRIIWTNSKKESIYSGVPVRH